MRELILARITDNSSLIKVNLSSLEIEDDEIIEIMIKIAELKPNLSKIDLDRNKIGDKGASILSQYLLDFKQLSELSVQFNAIGRDGAIYLFSLKRAFPGLDILFHGNKIHDMGEMIDIEHLAHGNHVKSLG